MSRLIYHIRYAIRLWQLAGNMTLWQAWKYPCDPSIGDGDPIEDVEAELSYWPEGSD